MLKTPEQYFADLSFDPPDTDRAPKALNSGERVFVEKYLGLDMLGEDAWPQPRMQKQPEAERRFKPVLEPKIEIAPAKIEIAPPPEPPQKKLAKAPAAKAPVVVPVKPEMPAPVLVVAPEKTQEPLQPPRAEEKAEAVAAQAEPAASAPEAAELEPAPEAALAEAAPVGTIQTEPAFEATAVETTQPAGAEAVAETPAAEKTATAEAVIAETPGPVAEKTAGAVIEAEKTAAAEQPVEKTATVSPSAALLQAAEAEAPAQKMVTMRDLASVESAIRMVSFYVHKQLFLLPVSGIYEVLRHMELIKVPQAPNFVAGAINLRGSVMPLIHLSALLTNQREHIYNERSFIIVYGTDSMRLGLIIDKINSMHMVDTDKIIWNVESRLGDAGDFLCAIANLDDRVCGILAPEMITQKLLSS